MTKQKDFNDLLKVGPLLPLLGQNYLSLETGAYPFLSEVLRKYNKKDNGIPHYGQLLQGNAKGDAQLSLAWMQQRCKHLPPPDWLRTIAKLLWNGIYIFVIDIIWMSMFESKWRSLQTLVEKNTNQSILEIT